MVLRFLPCLFALLTISEGATYGSICRTELSSIIQKQGDATPPHLWQSARGSLDQLIKGLEFPAGHGTFSDGLQQILSSGLEAWSVRDATLPKCNCLVDLRKADGLLAGYAFATRGNTSQLAVDSYPITKRDIVTRYGEVNELLGRFWMKPLLWLLRSTAKKFLNQRDEVSGFPVYLIYDLGSDYELVYPYPDKIPSEVRTRQSVRPENLQAILAPAAFYKNVDERLKEANLEQVEIYPLELLELEEIRRVSDLKKLFARLQVWKRNKFEIRE